MSKDIYFAILEELLADGMDYDTAGDRAYDLMRDRLADQADMLRKRAREER